MTDPLTPIHIGMGWIFVMFITYLIVQGIKHWIHLTETEVYHENEYNFFPELKVSKTCNRILGKNRVIPINESTDSMVAHFRLTVANAKRKRKENKWL